MIYNRISAAVVALLVAAGGASGQVLRGALYDSSGAMTSGVYELPITPGGTLNLVAATEAPTGGGVLQGETYFVLNLDNSMSYYASNDFWPYDAASFDKLTAVRLSGSYPYYRNVISALCCDPTDNKIYGVAGNDSRTAPVLYSYEFTISDYDVTPTRIAPLQSHLGAMAFDASGALYGIDTSGVLYGVDKSSGALERIGDTGIQTLADGSHFNFAHASACIDASGTMYWSVTNPQGAGALYKVNLSTAQAEKVFDYPSGVQVMGLYMSVPEADLRSPARPTELELDFERGQLEGGIWFKAPGTTYGGAALSGNLDFTVYLNDQPVHTGKVFYLSTRFAGFTVPSPGTYEVKVVVSNDFGPSPEAKIIAKIGYPQPATPVVNAIVEKGLFTDYMKIEWQPVTKDINGNDLEGEVAYRVIRYPGEVVVAETSTGTSVYDSELNSNVPGIYGYGVTAVCNEVDSDEGESQVVSFGHIEPPYSESFDDEISFAAYKNIDGDGDGRNWQYYSGEAIASPSDDLDCNDWLITPEVRLQKGRYYRVSIDVKVRDAEYPGIFRLCYGMDQNPSAMTEVCIGPVEVKGENFVRYNGLVHLEGSGEESLYIGLNAMSKKGGWWMHATRLNISAAMSGSEPDAPGNFSVVPDIDGVLKAEISFTAPTLDINGNQLSNISYVSVVRNGEEIRRIDNPAPGEEISFTDTSATEAGEYEYVATAFNSYGEGLPSESSVYLGIMLPSPPESAEAYETEIPGEVTVVWTPVTTYENGTPLNPANVTYNIWTLVGSESIKIQTGLTGESSTFTIMANPEEEQMMWQFGVTAETAAGENLLGAMTPYTPVGKPYDTPYKDSFSNLECAYPYVFEGSDYRTYWDNASDSTFENIKTQDNDNGMLVLYGRDAESFAPLSTGKISLQGLANPMLTFWVYNMADNGPDTNTIDVMVGAGRDFETLKTVNISESGAAGWNKVVVPLGDYAGRNVRVRLVGHTSCYPTIHLDNMIIRDRLNHDLAIAEFNAPAFFKSGTEYELGVVVENIGIMDAESFDVNVYSNDSLIGSCDMGPLSGDCRTEIFFPYLHPVDATGETMVKAVVVYDNDQASANNEKTVSVATVGSDYPAVCDLKATYSDEPTHISLSWSAPEMSGDVSVEVLEDFEHCPSWARSVGDWTFVDADNFPIYCFSTWIQLPGGAPFMGGKESWWILDSSYEPIVAHFSRPGFYQSYSGNKCLVSGAVYDGDYVDKKSDDWAISPILPGIAQTISFRAKSMLMDALETFEVLYSTTTTDIEEFTKISEVKDVPWEWTRYDFALPAGTRHFAIRSRSRDCFMLMIDDISFTASRQAEQLAIDGYNVYRDGERINSGLVRTTSYEDVIESASTPTYRVTAVYEGLGESNYSNAATPEYSAVFLIGENPEDGAEYFNLQGVRVSDFRSGDILIRRKGPEVRKVQIR